MLGWPRPGKRTGVLALVVTCLAWARGPVALAQAGPGGPTVTVPGSATLLPDASVTFEYAPGCPRGAPGQPTPSCGCCVPRFLSVMNASDQTVGVAYSLGTLEVLAPDGYVPQVYLFRPDFGFNGCEAVAGKANDVRCMVPPGEGLPGATASLTIQTQPSTLDLTQAALPADTGVALLTPPASAGAALDGLVAVNRSALPAQVAWDGSEVTLTVIPGFTPLAGGIGYWAYFAAPTTVTVAGEPRPLYRPLPAGRWTLIGNPFTTAASVSGPDAVYAYDPDTGGYAAATVLQPGQGAWAYSAQGGTATITYGLSP